MTLICIPHIQYIMSYKTSNAINKAYLRDLIAATGLVILLKLDSNRRFFSPCDLEIWWMTSKKDRAPLLHYIKLCASFQSLRWIQTGVTVRKRYRKTIGHFFYDTLSSVLYIISKPLVNSNWSYSPETLNSDFLEIFCPVWPWNLMDGLEKQ